MDNIGTIIAISIITVMKQGHKNFVNSMDKKFKRPWIKLTG